MGYDAQNCQRKLKCVLKTISNDADILDVNRQTIIKYKDYSLAQDLSLARISRTMYILRSLSKYLNKDFYKADKQDIIDIVSKINSDDKYAHTTKCELKITFKRFYSWLKGFEQGESAPEVKWIKVKRMTAKRITEQLLTQDDIKKLIDSTKSSRDKALIAVLAESGCRAGELLGMKLNDLTKDQYGFKVVVDGKTGPRKIRIITSVPYLVSWLNEHPKKDKFDAPVWISQKGKCSHLAYTGLAKICWNAKMKSNINKPCNPHMFRHARATYLAGHLSDALLKEYMGWTQRSNMTAVYVHLNGRQLDDELFKINGIRVKEEKIDPMKPKVCYCCKDENSATNMFCVRCGTVLDKDKMLEKIEQESERETMDKFVDKMLEDDKFMQKFADRFNSIKGAQ
jgi:integrase